MIKSNTRERDWKLIKESKLLKIHQRIEGIENPLRAHKRIESFDVMLENIT